MSRPRNSSTQRNSGREVEVIAGTGCEQQMDRDGSPDLRADRIAGGSEKALDAQVLLDPLEEELDLPTQAVQLRDGERWKAEVVGQKVELLAGLGVAVADTPQRSGIIVGRTSTRENDGLIADKAG